jgi:pyridoxal phosphate enzyme (YggS family)
LPISSSVAHLRPMADDTMSDIAENLRQVQERIEQAAINVGRAPQDIKLIAVTKTVAIERIQEARDAGVAIVGENYVQEARRKIEAIGHGIEWHFIGHLQVNKAKYAVRLFDLIHAVDSYALAVELDKRGAMIGKVVDCLIEVNLSGEGQKFGIRQERTAELAHAMSGLKNIALKGLMTMPPYADVAEASRPYFIALRELRNAIEAEAIPLPELSMGMSADFAIAIEEGATMVRIGRAIFGERSA